jgi:hypothetical protein
VTRAINPTYVCNLIKVGAVLNAVLDIISILNPYALLSTRFASKIIMRVTAPSVMKGTS